MKKLTTLTLFLISYGTLAAFGFATVNEENALIQIEKGAKRAPKDQYKLLLWNIYKGMKSSFEDELKKIKTEYEPDIAIFQEATYTEDQSLPCFENSDCDFSQAFKKNETSYGVLTTSHYPIHAAKAVHSDWVEPVLNTPKTSLISLIEINGTEFMVINTHGINFVTIYAYESQLEEIAGIAKSHKGPIIWAGDFNSWNIGRLQILKRAATSLDLEEISISNPDFIKSFMGYKLDRLFVRGLEGHKAKAFESKGSDHNPIILEFSIP